jgi:hypothetical protein
MKFPQLAALAVEASDHTGNFPRIQAQGKCRPAITELSSSDGDLSQINEPRPNSYGLMQGIGSALVCRNLELVLGAYVAPMLLEVT